MKRLLSRVFSRATLVGLFILAQVAAILLAVRLLGDQYEYFSAGCLLLSGMIVLHIVGKDTNPAYKIAWIIPIMAFPVFGGLLYLVFGGNRISAWRQRRMQDVNDRFRAAMEGAPDAGEPLAAAYPEAAPMSRYISRVAFTPAFTRTGTLFLPSGELYFFHLLEELKKAERFIFLEYYIIETGQVWDAIHAVLLDKVRQGVDVRLVYDDFGTMFRLPVHYERTLRAEGIPTCVFNRFRPVLSPRFNNRDHRKIAVIDGNVGFTGGVNIADRYANTGDRPGHWLDCGVMLRGEAVRALTAMFLSVWDYCAGVQESFPPFAPDPAFTKGMPDDGYVQPFTDTPLDNEAAGETVYLNVLNRAREYVYINTPYLIIDNEMLTALTAAAKCGVDVRLVTPAVSDGKIVQEMTRSYYEPLVEAGVKVYEYAPGMVHAKTFVSDDRVGVVGTINLDYRSLFLHFECAVWMCGSSAIADMKAAFLEELKDCTPISLDKCREMSRFHHFTRAVLRALAPLF